MNEKPTHTVTAAILRLKEKYLIAKRRTGSHLEGMWEFPGGTVEAGEDPEICLIRELEEELGIKAAVVGFFGESVYDYGIKRVRLLAFLVRHVSGEFAARDHEELKWVSSTELSDFRFAPADVPFVNKLQTMHNR